MKVAFWGTFDLGKPRNRILLRGLQENGAEVLLCHRQVWAGVDDKSRLTGWQRLHFLLRWLLAYPGLIAGYLRLPRHDVVLVGYLGQLDVLVLRPFARLRRVPVVWDAFLSLHDTVVDDRALVRPGHPLARLLFAWEWLAARAADRVLLDTRAHAEAFASAFGLPPGRVAAVFVGAEPEAFPPSPPSPPPGDPVQVLFYGQLIPLHGVETILRAARMAREEPFEWVLIGQGQEGGRVRQMLDEEPLPRLRWIPWVPYEELARWIGEADVCLGIFGAGGKASRVIPNKVFQVIAADRPLVTRDSPAIRELITPETSPGVYLVPPADPAALLAALRRFRAERSTLSGTALHGEIRKRILPRAIGRDLLEVLEGTV